MWKGKCNPEQTLENLMKFSLFNIILMNEEFIILS
jgi:hypothetical protein